MRLLRPIRDQRGFSMIELPISLAIMVMAMGGLMTLMVQNARTNKTQQMVAEMQSNARTCLQLIQDRLRSAGWDPANSGLTAITLDPADLVADDANGVDELEAYADFDGDGSTDGHLERVYIRRNGTRLEWRPSAGDNFVILAVNVTDDADGDGVPEPLFVPDSAIDPTRIVVQITTRSAQPDATSGEYLRYTLRSEVALRGSL